MSAHIDPFTAILRPMTVGALDGVVELELAVYPFPWTRGNFVDSLAAGYSAWTLNHLDGDLVGYCVAMLGVGEMHLLNITIAPAVRRAATRAACSPSWCGCAGRAKRAACGSKYARATARRARSTSASASRRSAGARATTLRPRAGARTRS
jgi:hypothetical protein